MRFASFPEGSETLNYFTQPVLFVRDEQIFFRNNAAKRLLLTEDDQLSQFLSPQNLDAYRAYKGKGSLGLTLQLKGQYYSTTVHRQDSYDIFVAAAQPLYEELSLDTLSVIAQIIRGNLTHMFDASSELFPMLEESEDPKIQRQTARLNKGLYQMLRLSANLSDTTRCIAGEVGVFLERTELTEFLGKVYDAVESLCDTLGIALQFQCPSTPFFAVIDRQKIERAVLNLLTNALQYTPRGGRVVLRLENQGSRAYIRVSDSGEGMDPDQMARLFDHYQHRDQLGSDPRWGVGMGLPLVRFIANLHGGTVIVNSSPDSGTAVTMSISRRLEPTPGDELRSPILNYDYAGGYDHTFLELSDVLPNEVFDTISLI